MRVTVLILGLLLGLLLFLQSVSMGVGIVVPLLWLIASAIVLPFPLASAIVFVIAGILSFPMSRDFADMQLWGVFALVLAVLACFGWRNKRKQDAERRTQDELQTRYMRQQLGE